VCLMCLCVLQCVHYRLSIGEAPCDELIHGPTGGNGSGGSQSNHAFLPLLYRQTVRKGDRG
jgi:hypothetical protein